ncbi:MAG: PQQ-dependent sugar dehydrogenase [Nitrososphaeraceae archaeon]
MSSFACLITLLVLSYCFELLAQGDEALGEPTLKSAEFHLHRVVDGLSRPTGLTFLGPDDFLVIEEDTGKVKRVIDGEISQPILDLGVSTDNSRGLIGIDSYQNESKTYVFLYYTESSSSRDGEDDPLGNRLYRYELSDDKDSLINPKLLLDLPAGPGSMDNGGPVLVGPDNYIYLVIGQIQDDNEEGHKTKAQNFEEGLEADGTSGVHRVTQDGEIVATEISDPAAETGSYFAYGIRNSFGMDFDPITGKLWLSENGVRANDEINLIESGFNGGWKDLTGFAPSGFNYSGLVSFKGTGKYSDPKFVWNQTVAPTALLFFNSDRFGPDYKNDMFVGDYAFGRIYHFELDSERTGLRLSGTLADKVANSDSELQSTIFGEGFGVPTDLEIGPDGMLYVTSLRDGAVYRITR